MNTLIRNASVVNEGKIFVADVLILNDRIEKIVSEIDMKLKAGYQEINAEGLYLIPGVIDDQVHFREPGLTHKGDISSESKAAVAGGITSFMDMPNTIPNTLTLELLEEKYSIASQKSLANYSFFMGINKNNIEEALKTDTENVCGITDDGLYFNNDEGILANYPDFLEKLFSRTNTLVALHCEDDNIIKRNTEIYWKKYGDNIPFNCHPLIRNEEACLRATERVLCIAGKHNNRLHLLHISTLAEANLFNNKISIRDKRITAEACVHHLWFSDKDYEKMGSKIKWNPSIKTEADKNGLLQSLLDNKLDIIATDHAPHTIEEKAGNYFQSLSGCPLVQHALPVMLELYHQGKISIEKLVEKTSHHVAEIYRIKERGYIREGYYADLVLLDINNQWEVTTQNLLYKCKWSPLSGQIFKSRITHTFVNGNLVYENGNITGDIKGKRLKFEKIR
ncbi:MAG: dihydroorotase [Hydrotalea flava]|uniref:dihydroorotase n=1 Tax=Hydrotalea TaxID=1004300 RepID=UPI0016A2B87C|nr:MULTISPECIES: dihydroorotase [Hydrotalea]MBY0347633.1 dihydroorotase [Hydrotalea flava]NIM35122.1 dihydroorotase [Hydrotalea flava]NIM37948.1 dihydroorotase [Hydrotalea flava]NIN03117.1 dihydroorotase [Hydrotalea flava]NIN14802.1 dihydroorotase [Hydrotalea flava]